jgi:hypothetical protein
VKSKSGGSISFPPRIDNQLTSLYGYVVDGEFFPPPVPRQVLRPETELQKLDRDSTRSWRPKWRRSIGSSPG